MTLIHSIILGIVEGLTEFLPISSTGHMVLVSHFLKVENAATLATFEVVVQVGAIGAVILLFFKKLLQLNLAKKLAVAFIPTGIVGVIVYPFIKSWLQNPILVAVMLVIGGICILLVERWYEKKLDDGDVEIVHDLTYRQALLLGVYQALAVVPGVSRSGAMIIGGLTMKLPRKLLTEFTFLLAVPTMILATLYTIYKKHSELSFGSVVPILLGTIVSFVVALFVIKYFLAYIRSHSFKVFGWYRIIIGIILLVVLI
jgi:undecaprenyl-diphosphatase